MVIHFSKLAATCLAAALLAGCSAGSDVESRDFLIQQNSSLVPVQSMAEQRIAKLVNQTSATYVTLVVNDSEKPGQPLDGAHLQPPAGALRHPCGLGGALEALCRMAGAARLGLIGSVLLSESPEGEAADQAAHQEQRQHDEAELGDIGNHGASGSGSCGLSCGRSMAVCHPTHTPSPSVTTSQNQWCCSISA